jgi:pimeloyl-ACP methyl ester carboxylesterase
LRLVALHGLPTSPRLWERLVLPSDWVLSCPSVRGLGPEGTDAGWSLEACVQQLRSQTESADVILGHDLGGVVAAMVAKPGQTLVLSGTALGCYWWAIRGTAMPLLHRWFYQRYGGRRFLSQGSLPEHEESLLAAFGDHGPGWSDRMRRIARAMKPPAGLAQGLRACNVHLVWGTRDPWYPAVVAHSVQRGTGGQLHWLPCGHFAPWEDPEGFSHVLTRLR